MSYRYEFDDRPAGHFGLTRPGYAILQDALRLLRERLEAWNDRALEHGAASRPYEAEVDDLNRMIGWGDERLPQPEAWDIHVPGISVGSLRYAKAALILAIRRREQDREDKAKQGWPHTALRSLDGGIERIRKIAATIQYEPSDVLWELTPRDVEIVEQKSVQMEDWDVFISHAHEDKDDFARPLAEGLRARGLSVWFDEFTLTVGDSLRRSIDRGLARSRFGVVVISPNFLRKEWPQRELDGLVAREIAGVKVILPVWHQIAAEEIRNYSPTLADRLAASSKGGLDHVIAELMRAIGPSDRPSATVARQAASASPAADVRVTLRGPTRRARFVIENLGPTVARDVHLEIDLQEGSKSSPLVAGDCTEKLPIAILRPGARVELLAALTFDTGTSFRARWQWREDDGRLEERAEKVSLQNG